MAGLRTSREVYMRVRWDASFDETQFLIGYDDRAAGMKEIPFTEFVPDGDIPWHRVWYFRSGDVVYWDRARKVDLIFGSGESESATQPPTLAREKEKEGGPHFRPLEIVRAEGAAWHPGSQTLRVATYNVLFDVFEAERIYTDARIPAILEVLSSLDADVIVLEEVTPRLVAALRAAAWVQTSYAMSGDEEAVSPHGQLVLSRLPVISFAKHDFGRDKSLVVAELEVAGEPLALAAVHLSSSRAEQARQKRASELAVAREFLSFSHDVTGAADALICGDFNLDDEAEVRPLIAEGFADAWPSVRTEVGFTFDPRANPLAHMMSRSKRQQRIDRLFFRSPGARLGVREARLFGREPFEENRYPSDHWGLICDFAVQPREAVTDAPVHHSALIVRPPDSDAIDEIRDAWDPHAERWMPHINLLYGFVPDHHFDAAVRALEQALAGFAPFEVTLETFSHFDHRRSCTVWLDPAGERLADLQALVHSVFPQCREQNLKSGSGFRAHLSVAQLRGDDTRRRESLMSQWQSEWQPIRFEVAELALISRRGSEPFEVRARVKIGQSSTSKPWEEYLETPQQTRARRDLMGRLEFAR